MGVYSKGADGDKPWVMVPVLSEQMFVTAPRLSKAFIFLTITLRFTMRLVPDPNIVSLG